MSECRCQILNLFSGILDIMLVSLQEDGDKRIDLAPGQLMEHDHDVCSVNI